MAEEAPTPGKPRLTRAEAFRKLALVVNSDAELPTVLDSVTEIISRSTAWTYCWISAVDFTNGHSVVVGRSPTVSFGRELPGRAWSLHEGPARDVLLGGELLVIDDPAECDYPAFREEAAARSVRAALLCPVPVSDLVGRPLVLNCQSRRKVSPDQDELAFIETCAQLIAASTKNALRVREDVQLSIRLRSMSAAVLACMRALSRRKSVTEILHEASREMDAPMAIADSGGHLLGEAVPDGYRPHDRWDAALRGLRRELRDARRPAAGPASWAPGSADPTGLAATSAAAGALRVIELPLDLASYYLAVFHEADNPLGPWLDVLTSAVGAIAMAHVISDEGGDDEAGSAGLLTRYIAAGDEDRERVVEAMRLRGIDVDLRYRLVVTGLRGGAAADGTSSAEVLHELRRELHRGLGRLLPPATLSERAGGRLLALIPADGWTHDDLDRAGARSANARKDVRVVASDPFDGLRGLAAAGAQVTALERVAAMLPERSAVSSSRAGVLAILAAGAEDPVAESVIRQHLGPLLSHEKGSRADLFTTLRCFLDRSGHVRETANALHVHISTVQYRIRRIEQILGCSLADADTRFTLAVVLRLHELRQATSEGGPTTQTATRPAADEE